MSLSLSFKQSSHDAAAKIESTAWAGRIDFVFVLFVFSHLWKQFITIYSIHIHKETWQLQSRKRTQKIRRMRGLHGKFFRQKYKQHGIKINKFVFQYNFFCILWSEMETYLVVPAELLKHLWKFWEINAQFFPRVSTTLCFLFLFLQYVSKNQNIYLINRKQRLLFCQNKEKQRKSNVHKHVLICLLHINTVFNFYKYCNCVKSLWTFQCLQV